MSAHPPFFSNAQIMMIDPADIDTSDRTGFFFPDKAVALGRLMAVDGQRTPISVYKHPNKGSLQPWKLAVGKHRTEGCALEGKLVMAIEVTGKPEDFKDMESSENLHRRPLGPLERAKFTAALAQAARERIAREQGDLKQQQHAVKARWERVKTGDLRADQALQDETDDARGHFVRAYSWQDSVADALGMDPRTIRRDLTLFRLIVEPFPDLVEQLAHHPVVGENASQLKAIADIRDEGARRQVIEQLLADEEISVDDARINAGVDRPAGPPPAQHQKFYDQITGGWSRLGTAERRRFLPNMVAMLTPDMKRTLRDLLTEELGA